MVERVGGSERPPWLDVVRVVSMAVGAVALVAIAFFVKDMRDDTRQQSCLAGVQTYVFASARLGADDYVDAINACGYQMPPEDERSGSTTG